LLADSWQGLTSRCYPGRAVGVRCWLDQTHHTQSSAPNVRAEGQESGTIPLSGLRVLDVGIDDPEGAGQCNAEAAKYLRQRW